MQNLSDRSLARSSTYTFLSQLYLLGPVPELYPYIEEITELSLALTSQGDDTSSIQTVNQDHLAADHFHIFGLNVLPYESSFLEPNFVFEGPVTERVLTDYWNSGFNPDTKSESADHIGWELKFLGELCKKQAEAEKERRRDIASQMLIEQLSFLEGHLLRWLPGFVQAVYQQKMLFYTSLVDITLDIIIDHYQELLGSQHRSIFQDFMLPDPPDILLEEKSGLRDISRFLLTPVFSGVYISREIIEGIAKSQKLPRGFGDRETMLTNLLRNAADYDQLTSVLDNITHMCNDWMSFYARLPERCQDPNMLMPFTTPWQERIQNCLKILNHIHSTASNNQKG